MLVIDGAVFIHRVASNSKHDVYYCYLLVLSSFKLAIHFTNISFVTPQDVFGTGVKLNSKLNYMHSSIYTN